MNDKIISELTDYIAAYERYISSVEKKSLTKGLTKVYHKLLTIAEKNADDFDKFNRACIESGVYHRFQAEIEKCKKEFKTHI